MKGTARQTRTKDGRAGRAAARVQTKARPRPGAGNRHRADAYERQAEDVAKQAMRGERDIGRHLTLFRPAHFAPAGSVGYPLPPALRERMENALGADLRAVRIHSGGVADLAAREHDAEALTSGRNIYFRAGRWAPGSFAGQELLLHELAHVLQQTGLRTAGGRIRATDATGSGEVQRKDTFVDFMNGYELFHESTRWDDIKKAYASVPDVKTHTDIIESYFPDTFPMSPAQVDAMASETLKEDFKTLPDPIQGLYVDALKEFGGYEAAWKIVSAKTELPTAYRSYYFYEHARSQSLSWIYRLATANTFVKDYYPARFINAYKTFFLFPGYGGGDLEPSTTGAGAKTFSEKIKDEIKAVKKTPAPGTNELQAAALTAFFYLDDNRKNYLPSQLKAHREAGKSLLKSYQDLTAKYESGSVDELSPSVAAEPTALFAAVLPEIRKHAAKAAVFWKRAGEIQAAQIAGLGFGAMKPEEVKALTDAIKSDPRFKNFPKVFLQTAKAVFERPKGKLLTASAFAARVAAQRDALRLEMTRYGQRISELIAAGTDAEAEGLRIGLALAYLSDVEQVLAGYDGAKDTSKRPDQRIATRIRLAHKLQDLGRRFGWDDLRDAANDVFNEGLQIAILGSWTQDTNIKFGDLSKQAGGMLTGLEGTNISGALLDQFAYIEYFKVLSAELTRLLEARKSDFSAGRTPILAEAFKKANQDTRRPRRFIVREWEVADPSMQKGRGGFGYVVEPFGKMVLQQPSVIDLVKKEEKKDEITLAPTERFDSDRPLHLWIVPRFDEFIKLISGIEVVRKAVTAFWQQAHPDKELPDPAKQTYPWLQALMELAIALNTITGEEEGDSEQAKAKRKAKQDLLKSIGDAIFGAVETEFTKEEKLAHDKARLAVNHQRRVIVENDLRPALTTFDRGELGHWSVPDQIFRSISGFAQLVWPKTDQALQVTALAIEIADELMTAFGPKDSFLGTSYIRRWDIIDTVLVLSFEAMRFWDSEEEKVQAAATAGTAAYVNGVEAISWLTRSQLQKRARTLGRLRDVLGGQAEAIKKRDGLRGHKDKHSLSSIYWDDEGFALIKWNMRYESLTQGQVWTLYGDEFTMVDVHETFTFHPRFGEGRSLGVGWPGGGGRPGEAALLDENGNPWEPSGKTLITIVHKSQSGTTEVLVITDKDFERLAWLSNKVSEHFGYEYIAGAGVFIEKYASLLMDVLELVPGLGQGVAAARFAANVIATISSPEFQDLIEAFSKDGFAAIPQAFEALARYVDFEELANVLIFDWDFKESTRGNRSLKGKKDRQAKIAGRQGPWQRIGVMLKNLIEVGVRVLDRIKRLAKRVQTPVRDTQLWVLRTPAAVLILDLIERGFDVLSSLSIDDLAQAAEDLVDKGWRKMIEEEAMKAGQRVADRGRDIIDTIRHLELPEKIVPVEWIIDFVIDLAVRALSAKYRKGVEAVRGVLRTLGLWDKVLDVIKMGMYEAGADPNELYQQHVRTKLEPWLEQVRDDFTEKLTSTLVEVPFLSTLTKPEGTPISIDFSGFGFPEAEGYAADASRAPWSTERLPRPTGGAHLPRGQRLNAEASMGHDFGHVRLHRGGDADRVTRSFGADAVTSGSHVYLSSTVNPDEPGGRRILHHELGHVLQQTGSRRLGGTFSNEPSAGRPNRGLLYDSARESAADRAAGFASAGGVAGEPVTVGGAASGVQPAFTKGFLRKFLRHLHEVKDIAENEEELEKKKGGVALDAEGAAIAGKLSGALKPWLDKAAAWQDPFASVRKEMKTFAEAVWPKFESMIPLLVSMAVRTMDPPTDAGSEAPATPPPRVPYYDKENLKVELERALYGLTSMAFVIDLKTITGPATVKGREIVDSKDPVTKVTIVYVHLPLLPENDDSEKLWDLLVENTFKTDKDYNKTSQPSFKAATKIVIVRGSPSPDTYQSKRFAMMALRAKVVRGQRERLMHYVDTTKTPTWPTTAQYTQDKTTGLGALENIGLRVGTYDVWGPDAKDINDRDAHHAAQFLLVEYFRNAKKKQPFPLLGTQPYPGVAPIATTEVKTIKSHLGGTINVDRFYGGRGGAMPTIFIARTTHQSNIHYRTEAPDDGTTKRVSQGASMHNTFRGKLGDIAPVMDDAAVLGQLAQRDKEGKPDEPVQADKPSFTVNKVRAKIFEATQETYKDMWQEMKPKLRRALEVQEVQYYNTVAKLRSLPTIDKSAMAAPFKAIADATESVIGGATGGGFGPGFSPKV